MESFEEVVDGPTTWRFERDFLASNWTCVWGRGCVGIGPEPAEALGHGCCSVGAQLDEGDEARLISAMAAMIPRELFQFADEADDHGVFSDDERTNTKVVDGACIFLNRPGFGGGAGCALHLAAVSFGDSPVEWKPSVCWQLPIKVDWVDGPNGTETATVRRWQRADWGEIGEEMAWCCTEGDRAYVGDRPVIESLADELEELVGAEVFVQLRRRLT
jgi:hypothetical protein